MKQGKENKVLELTICTDDIINPKSKINER